MAPPIVSDTPRTDAVLKGEDDAYAAVANVLRHARKLERELSRYKRLEALLRNESDVEDVPDCGDEQIVRPNDAMRLLSEWEEGK